MSFLSSYDKIELTQRLRQSRVNLTGDYMTESQRDYLADLANRKGIRIEGAADFSVAQASAKIEELKAMPDYDYPEITDEQAEKIDRKIEGIRSDLKSWGFE